MFKMTLDLFLAFYQHLYWYYSLKNYIIDTKIIKTNLGTEDSLKKGFPSIT